MARPSFTRLIESLPATVPFVAPEALERKSGRRLRLRLGANESVFGVSPLASMAMANATSRIAWYADPESFELREKLAELHRIRRENLVVGSGIDDLLGLIVRVFVDPGAPIVTSLGAYPTLNYHAAGYGCEIHRVPYKNDHNDLEGLAQTATRVGARAVYLANPDNPTGTWHTTESIREFLGWLPETCLLIFDEAYVEFAPPADVFPIDADDPRLIRLRTFSKLHGMAGARIGYGIATRETIDAFDKVRHHFGVNMFAQVGALASLDDVEFMRQVVAAVEAGRQDYYRLAQELGLSSLRSATNFVAIDLGTYDTARVLVDTLLERDVFVRMPGAAPLNRFIRVTVGTASERVAFGEVLRQLAKEGKIPADSIAAGKW
jgi:histidinol-phosphate aminotransferase